MELHKIEEDKRKKYNPDNIFKKRTKEKNVSKNNLPIELKKEKFFKKLVKFIKNIINKR